jgi:beta-phosphoglucomutase
MIKAVIFDFDGTVFDSEPMHFDAHSKALKERFGLSLEYPFYLQHYAGISDQKALPKILTEHDIDISDMDMDELIRFKKSFYTKHIEKTVSIPSIAGLPEFLTWLKTRYPIAICSNSTRAEIDTSFTKIEQGNLRQHFETIVSADMVYAPKPSPEGYLFTAKKLGVKSEECLVFEDSPPGITAAKAAGMTAVGLLTTYPAERLTQADAVIADFTEANILHYFQ